jgi:Fe-S oxidoreductase/uncharacterized membrane protein
MQFNWFVLPFMAGMVFLMSVVVYKLIRWLYSFEGDDFHHIMKYLFSSRTLMAAKEIFMESLLHRKIFKINFKLGWMHMSFAFGWLLLIVIGKLETLTFTGDFTNPVWYAIFFRFFEPGAHSFFLSDVYAFLMDAILLMILVGLAMAMYKRFQSFSLGLKRATSHSLGDKWALTFIWMIFPLRFLAESVTAGLYGGGSFLTGGTGFLLSEIPHLQYLFYPLWWAYSLVLGAFFVFLPFSRYMHIPAEVILILFRNWGVKTDRLKAIEVEACSRCGICIDGCAMVPANRKGQAVYFLRQWREGNLTLDTAQNCLQCGSCQERCPVGIHLNDLRLDARKGFGNILPVKASDVSDIEGIKTDVIYFPGCVGRLSPSVNQSMMRLASLAGVNMNQLGNELELCCGRPLLLSGHVEEANLQVAKLEKAIKNSGAKTLVTSCPVCYNMFLKNYHLKIRVVHHSELIHQWITERRIKVQASGKRFVYHDPCELGRANGFFEMPREVLGSMGLVIQTAHEKEASLCCGGSLADFTLTNAERNETAVYAMDELTAKHPDYVVTACPMCKKSLKETQKGMVKDIAEVTCEMAIPYAHSEQLHLQKFIKSKLKSADEEIAVM